MVEHFLEKIIHKADAFSIRFTNPLENTSEILRMIMLLLRIRRFFQLIDSYISELSLVSTATEE